MNRHELVIEAFDSTHEAVVLNVIEDPSHVHNPLSRPLVERAAVAVYADLLAKSNVLSEDIPMCVQKAWDTMASSPEALAKITTTSYEAVTKLRAVNQPQSFSPSPAGRSVSRRP